MLHVFVGYDRREAIGSHVFLHSLLERASSPVAVTHLASLGLAQGTNEFTCSRFLVPHLMGLQGAAVFMDGADMLMRADISDIMREFDPSFAVQVVKHSYKTRNPRKYVGTEMEADNTDYHRKNWASVMLFNCAHNAWHGLSYSDVAGATKISLLQFRHVNEAAIGTLSNAWNRLVDEGQSVDGAKVLHWTAGIPGFPAYTDAPGAALWHEAHADMLRAQV